MTIYTCLGMLIESLCHVGTMVCLLRRLGLLHVGFQLQNLQLQQHFSANIVQCLSTPVSGCDAVWDVCIVRRYQRPIAVGNNLFALHVNHADRLRPTGLDHVAFRKTPIGTSEPLEHCQPRHHPCRHPRRRPRVFGA